MDMELIQQQLNNVEQCYNNTNDGNNGRLVKELGPDLMFPLSVLPPQPPLLRDYYLFHSLPHGGFAIGGSSSSSLFDERDQLVLNNNNVNVNVGFYQDVNGIGRGFEFTADMNDLGKNRDGKDPKHFATEKQRRVHFNDKFQALRKLIPNPTKNDRASILGDAIEYINELKSTASKLKDLVEKKRCSCRERIKRPSRRQKTTTENDVKSELEDMLQCCNGVSLSSSSSWHRTKSKNNNTEVDVRIVDDEVTVKLIVLQKKKGTNCLLLVSMLLDELQLHLYHVAGGLIGDYYSFLFNSKIFQGTTVYASDIANTLVEAMEKHVVQYTAAIAPPALQLSTS
nr:transcription factor bHLH91-like [Ipomoea batatas]